MYLMYDESKSIVLNEEHTCVIDKTQLMWSLVNCTSSGRAQSNTSQIWNSLRMARTVVHHLISSFHRFGRNRRVGQDCHCHMQKLPFNAAIIITLHLIKKEKSWVINVEFHMNNDISGVKQKQKSKRKQMRESQGPWIGQSTRVILFMLDYIRIII